MPEQKKKNPTRESPPPGGTTPPADAPPMKPSWLLVANKPFAVARDSPASSEVNTQVTGSKIVKRRAPALHNITAVHTPRPAPNAKPTDKPPSSRTNTAQLSRRLRPAT